MAATLSQQILTIAARRSRWTMREIVFWLAALATVFLVPAWHPILNEIAIFGLFALSLDLILGYAGIVSLGQAAFFGFGAYAAGLLANGVVAEPVLGLLAAGAMSAILGFIASFLVLRGSDLTRLMVTLGVALVLGEAANRLAWLTGGADGLQVTVGPVLGLFDLSPLFPTTSYAYSLAVVFILFVLARRLVASPFGLSLRSIRDNPLRAAAIGIPVNRRLVAIYTIAAAYAGVAGALTAQTAQTVSLDVFGFERSADVMLVLIIGGTGYLYGGLAGACLFRSLQDVLSTFSAQHWHFYIGLILVALVLVGRDHLTRSWAAVMAPLGRLIPARWRFRDGAAPREV